MTRATRKALRGMRAPAVRAARSVAGAALLWTAVLTWMAVFSII